MTNGRKQLSPEDQEIWQRITRTASPLSQKNRNFPKKLTTREPHRVSTPALNGSQRDKNYRETTAPIYQSLPSQTRNLDLSQIDVKTARKLSKGKIAIDGRLDLHGYTQSKAHHLLYDYIEHAYYSQKRIILVITGKGNLGQGILRENVPKWLGEAAFRLLVSEYHTAHATHGGSGALYIRIRRKP